MCSMHNKNDNKTHNLRLRNFEEMYQNKCR